MSIGDDDFVNEFLEQKKNNLFKLVNDKAKDSLNNFLILRLDPLGEIGFFKK